MVTYEWKATLARILRRGAIFLDVDKELTKQKVNQILTMFETEHWNTYKVFQNVTEEIVRREINSILREKEPVVITCYLGPIYRDFLHILESAEAPPSNLRNCKLTSKLFRTVTKFDEIDEALAELKLKHELLDTLRSKWIEAFRDYVGKEEDAEPESVLEKAVGVMLDVLKTSYTQRTRFGKNRKGADISVGKNTLELKYPPVSPWSCVHAVSQALENVLQGVVITNVITRALAEKRGWTPQGSINLLGLTGMVTRYAENLSIYMKVVAAKCTLFEQRGKTWVVLEREETEVFSLFLQEYDEKLTEAWMPILARLYFLSKTKNFVILRAKFDENEEEDPDEDDF